MHLYFLFSMFRKPNFDNILEDLGSDDGVKKEYMSHFKKPSTFFLKKGKDNTYSVDPDKGYSEEKMNEVLMEVGTLMEYMLTHSKETMN